MERIFLIIFPPSCFLMVLTKFYFYFKENCKFL